MIHDNGMAGQARLHGALVLEPGATRHPRHQPEA